VATLCYNRFYGQLHPIETQFIVLPFMHSEKLQDQEKGIEILDRTLQEIRDAQHVKIIENTKKFAIEHKEIIERFGRFPHRNAALGRPSTAQELEYLRTAPRFGQ
jgi:uncharacterized protein (DUF924 family)